MSLINDKNALLVIIGPTAVGKTDIAIDIADQVGGEIISADSRLFYRGMDIGTAKPSLSMQKNVPHHLIDIADPDQVISLAEYQQLAYETIDRIISDHKIPILVGGTGQYVRAIVEGWRIPELPPDPNIRQALQKWADEIGGMELYKRLLLLDPDAEKFIDPTNVRRTIRALEVILCTGRKFSELREKSGSRYTSILVGLQRSRKELYQRIDARIAEMILNGFVDEVKALISQGYSLELPSMTAIGYKEIGEYLMGRKTLTEAIMEMKKRTRIFVRRQANWFKESDQNIHWFPMEPNPKDQIINLMASSFT